MVSKHCIERKKRRRDDDDDKYYLPQVLLKRLHKSLKLLNLRPALYILKQKAVILNTCCIARKFLAEQCIRSAWSMRPIHFGEPA